ncbi:uncharacterized protein (DUF305 family) [Microbacterium sp. SLBN-154]|uniref:DUF305 domain-containing protein n=1 Tax=Microbacterium sp. SLBN-154 TaxID=2768458 RepID=UPI001153856D|nr:DUF305 domain-containing protein [Microbacterium sp. SLBN-154]TQK20361.1 uncharacterized protein (DUF305 family) [Microbacterium sp. SLBN-154]
MTDATASRRGFPRWALIALIALGIATLAFAIGRFSMFGAASAVAAPGTTSAEAGFARDMQVHHAQAIEMAMEIYRKTEDDEVRALSYDIATGQSGQRGEMYGWLVSWGLPQSGGPLMGWMAGTDHAHGGHGGGDGETLTTAELEAEMGMATPAELDALRTATGTPADCDFLALMIRHHQGAIPMSEAVIDLGSEPRVLAVAQSIIETQEAEIDRMTSMQQRLGCTG